MRGGAGAAGCSRLLRGGDGRRCTASDTEHSDERRPRCAEPRFCPRPLHSSRTPRFALRLREVLVDRLDEPRGRPRTRCRRRSAGRSRASASPPSPARASARACTMSWMRSRTIVTMSRYSSTSASSQTRPCPGMTNVPPSCSCVGHRDVEDAVERRSITPWTLPPLRAIDDRIARGDEDVAGDDHVGAAEEHDRVAVGVRRRLVIEHHGFAVEEDVLLLGEVGVGRPGGRRRRRLSCPPARSSGSARFRAR